MEGGGGLIHCQLLGLSGLRCVRWLEAFQLFWIIGGHLGEVPKDVLVGFIAYERKEDTAALKRHPCCLLLLLLLISPLPQACPGESVCSWPVPFSIQAPKVVSQPPASDLQAAEYLPRQEPCGSPTLGCWVLRCPNCSAWRLSIYFGKSSLGKEQKQQQQPRPEPEAAPGSWRVSHHSRLTFSNPSTLSRATLLLAKLLGCPPL